MFESDDYYEILDVDRDASAEAIKKAFKKRAREFHPDQSDDPDAEEKFKQISEAYEVLGDEEMRARYDRYGKEGVETSAAGGQRRAGGFNDIQDLLNQMGFGDFSDFFGGGGRRGRGSRGGQRRKRRGADLKMKAEIDFEDAVFGTTEQFTVEKNEPCENCDGSGSLSGGKTTCPTCDGRGKVSQSQGAFRITETCPDCRGRGQKIEDPCPECNGSGMTRRDKTFQAEIPAGIQSGQRIRIDNEGEPGEAGRGDLYLEVQVRPHDRFKRKDADLYTQVPISFVQAALGGTVEVPLLDEGESEELKLEPGVQTGEVFVVRDRGVPRLKGRGRGDLHVQVQVVTPTDLSGEERELLEEFADVRGSDVQGDEESIYRKIYETFTG